MQKKPIKKLRKDLIAIFSYYIRLRDSMDGKYGRCITCGRIKEILYMDAGHFIKAGSSLAVRFDEKNVNLQCKYCNGILQGNDAIYAEKLDEKYGPGTAEMLRIKSHNICKWTRFEWEALLLEYKQKLKAMGGWPY